MRQNAINQTKITIYSTTAPTSPTTGTLWCEVDTNISPLYGWSWQWNGSNWISPDQYFYISQNGIMTSNSTIFYIDTNFSGLYIKDLSIESFISAAQSASNYWTVQFDRRNSANTTVSISNLNTQAMTTALVWIKQISTINTSILFSGTGMIASFITYTPTGTAGMLYGSGRVRFNFIR